MTSRTDLTIIAIEGLPEIGPDDDLAALVGEAIADSVRDGDILAITSKIVSKAEGRCIAASDREDAITAETVRLVASREHAGGLTRIVQNRNGFVLAAAGVDASNTPEGTVLLLPVDPDASARRLRTSLQQRFGMTLGIVVTDTFGRPWREGQTDVAIGAAGIIVSEDLAGSTDAHGRKLEVTNTAIADEMAGAADLVKGKSSGCPVAVIRGMGRFVTAEDGPGTRALVRPAERDMFGMGTDEAYAAGYAAGLRDAEVGDAGLRDAERDDDAQVTGDPPVR